jgi:rubredoxin---NAD+ reductase
MADPIVIIGSGMAGYAVAREFRKLNSEAPLLMITQDDGTSYSKPMLSTGFTKAKSAKDLAMASASDMSEQLNMSMRTHAMVESIDTAAKTLSVDGSNVSYDRLVLATGAQVNVLPFLASTAERVCSINDMDDYRIFREKCSGLKRIAIIGTGLIGCEYANDLLNGGYDIDLIGPSSEVLDTLLPLEASKCVTRGLEEAGVNLHLNQNVVAIKETESSVIITLDSGEKIEADLAVSAIGLKPNTRLAEDAGLATDKGIVCNRSLMTTAPDVFTIGDCAEVDGHVLLYVLPLMAGARALAKTLNGTPTDLSYGVMPVMVKTPACPVVVLPPLSNDGEWECESDGFSSKSLYKNTDGDILGFALTGDATKEKQALSKLAPPIHQ